MPLTSKNFFTVTSKTPTIHSLRLIKRILLLLFIARIKQILFHYLPNENQIKGFYCEEKDFAQEQEQSQSVFWKIHIHKLFWSKTPVCTFLWYLRWSSKKQCSTATLICFFFCLTVNKKATYLPLRWRAMEIPLHLVYDSWSCHSIVCSSSLLSAKPSLKVMQTFKNPGVILNFRQNLSSISTTIKKCCDTFGDFQFMAAAHYERSCLRLWKTLFWPSLSDRSSVHPPFHRGVSPTESHRETVTRDQNHRLHALLCFLHSAIFCFAAADRVPRVALTLHQKQPEIFIDLQTSFSLGFANSARNVYKRSNHRYAFVSRCSATRLQTTRLCVAFAALLTFIVVFLIFAPFGTWQGPRAKRWSSWDCWVFFNGLLEEETGVCRRLGPFSYRELQVLLLIQG